MNINLLEVVTPLSIYHLVLLNFSLIHWVSKTQNSVYSSRFGSEFVATQKCCEYPIGIRYKLRMVRIPCDGPYCIEGDDQYALSDTIVPDFILEKKNKIIFTIF